MKFHAAACLSLAILSLFGCHSDQHFDKELKAALAGDEEAMFDVAFAYRHGVQAPEDIVAAHAWIEKIAKSRPFPTDAEIARLPEWLSDVRTTSVYESHVTEHRLYLTVRRWEGGMVSVPKQSLFHEAEVEAGVPILSKIPWVDRLFTSRERVKFEQRFAFARARDNAPVTLAETPDAWIIRSTAKPDPVQVELLIE